MVELISQVVSIKSTCQVVGHSRSTFQRQLIDRRFWHAPVIVAIQLMLKKSPKAGLCKVVKRLNAGRWALRSGLACVDLPFSNLLS